MPITSRFTINGTDYDYRADQLTVRWREDRTDYQRVDYQIDTDIRAKLPLIQWEAVLVAQNANATGVSAADLYAKIEREVAAGNSASFVPDISASAPNSATPSLGIVTRSGGHPPAYETEQSEILLTRTFTVQGARWLQPSVTADKDLIDDLNSLSDPL